MRSTRVSQAVLTTPRLTLSRPAEQDIVAIHEICADPAVWMHLPSGRHTEIATTTRMVTGWMTDWHEHGLGVSIVRRRGDAQVLGYVGCRVKADTIWNLAYRLAPFAHGQGYAQEAATAAISQANAARPRLPITAVMLEHNVASEAVAKGLGLVQMARGQDSGNPDPRAVRLVYADRPLTDAQRQTAMS